MGQKFQTHRNTLDSDGPKKFDLTGFLYKKKLLLLVYFLLNVLTPWLAIYFNK